MSPWALIPTLMGLWISLPFRATWDSHKTISFLQLIQHMDKREMLSWWRDASFLYNTSTLTGQERQEWEHLEVIFFGSHLFSVAIIGSHKIAIIEVVNFSVPPQSFMSCLWICELCFALCLKCDNQPLLPMTRMINGVWLIQPSVRHICRL